MTKKNSTKKALLISCLSLMMCLSMLVGSTFAWFTDSAATGVNTIQAGNLDIKLSYKNATVTSWTEVSADDKLFDDNALWEPGYTEIAYLRVENNGSLALKYQLTVNVLNEVAGKNKDGDDIKLSEVLKYDLIELAADTTYADRAEALAEVSDAKNLATETVSGTMEATATAKYFALVVYMPTDVGDNANHDGENVPTIQLGVSLVATQQSSESDSFGNDYDAGVLFDNERRANNDAELAELLAGDLSGVSTIYLGEGTFNAFNLASNSTFDFVGAIDAEGKPATIVSMPTAPSNFTSLDDPSIWNGFKGSVKNVSFKAANDSGILALYSDNWSQSANASFENCTFENVGVKFYGSVNFKSCIFDGQNKAEKAIVYSVVPTGEVATFTDCAIKNYTNCGINIAESAGSLIVNNCILENCQGEGEYGIHVGLIDTVKITESTLKCDVHYYESLIKTFECDDSQFAEGFSASKE